MQLSVKEFLLLIGFCLMMNGYGVDAYCECTNQLAESNGLITGDCRTKYQGRYWCYVNVYPSKECGDEVQAPSTLYYSFRACDLRRQDEEAFLSGNHNT